MSDCCLRPNAQFFSYREQVTFDEMMMMSICTRPTRWVVFCSAGSLKQQLTDRHVAQLGHIILMFVCFFLFYGV